MRVALIFTSGAVIGAIIFYILGWLRGYADRQEHEVRVALVKFTERWDNEEVLKEEILEEENEDGESKLWYR